MSFSEKIRELDREVGDRVEQALASVRRELTDRLRRGTEEILQRFEEVRPELPASLLGHADVGPVEDEVRSAARRDALAELRDALAGLDRARSQGEILNALLAGSGRFASRAAVLLVRGGELKGWASRGFPEGEPSIREIALGGGEDGAWGRVGEGRGVVRLSAVECAALCSRLESPLPQGGVLVPLVLRDRVAAALYADATGNDELAVEALQTLAYVAAQAIETLPFRERASTPTLYPADAAAPAGTAEAAVSETAAAVAEAAPAEEAAPALDQAVSEPAPSEAAPPGTPAEPAWEEPQGEAAAATEAMPAAPDADAAGWAAEPGRGETEGETAAAPETEQAAAAQESAAAPESAAAEETDESLEDTAASAEPSAEPSPVPTPWGVRPVEAVSPAISDSGAGDRAEAAAADTGRETMLFQRPMAAPAPEPIPSPFAPAREESPEPAYQDREDAAEPVARSRPVGFAPAREADEGPRAGGTVEVQAPTDVQGPGWAFATTRVPVSPDEETLHEEARRLARLLVSEIKLYNEDQVDEGRRNRDLYERLKEDIDRSRQMYEERVEPRVLKSTDYFYQELVRILAAGDARALGI